MTRDLSTPPRELAGLTAVVTGASTGIGRATALELARGGAAVVVHARRSLEAAEALAAEIRAAGGLASVLVGDVASASDRARMIDEAWAWRAGVDAWVNNAGLDVLTGPAADWSFEQKMNALWQVDVVGTVELSRLIGARMKTRGQGAIVNTGWDQVDQGMAGDSGELFATIKGAIMAFSRSLARSLAPEVRVNTVAPGWIRTAWGAQASEVWQQRARRESLLERWGTPEDVARATRYLVSPAASFITGQTLPVNGGFRHSQ